MKISIQLSHSTFVTLNPRWMRTTYKNVWHYLRMFTVKLCFQFRHSRVTSKLLKRKGCPLSSRKRSGHALRKRNNHPRNKWLLASTLLCLLGWVALLSWWGACAIVCIDALWVHILICSTCHRKSMLWLHVRPMIMMRNGPWVLDLSLRSKRGSKRHLRC